MDIRTVDYSGKRESPVKICPHIILPKAGLIKGMEFSEYTEVLTIHCNVCACSYNIMIYVN